MIWQPLKELILPGRNLRDRMEERDWRRPWRDPPGMSASCNCGGNTACLCSGIPNTLHATFSNSGKCTNLDSQTVALVLAAGAWSYSFTYGTCTITVSFTCVPPSTWRLGISNNQACSGGTTTTAVGTCGPPLNVNFTGMPVPQCFNAQCGATGCNGVPGSMWNVTVTL